ncbi:ABC transporter permease [Janthinobacterium agaricidamnosum]|uniref:Permease family protein n=1 Tax=Janthinobacterium agaricidamnosum NBRC 102515 = DSM 9628 TaxID=1349767 RepID=W0V336_9BURK|nr:ABC transporter permease [Janthinobacterium agaricidamnosum]CDG83249.1 permease family protein [Janthinobacterium agaricidamnosum NBRC 102515 = DSM 9628]
MSRLNALSLAIKALRHKPLSTALNLLLMAIGVGMMTFVLSTATQLEDGALRDGQGIDLVVGAKGSPLQLILSSIYHIDIPTGNIPFSAQQQLEANPMVRHVIPLALGDNFYGFRIVGTSHDYFRHYGAELQKGRWFDEPMQAVFGALAARDTGATIGAKFAGSHGLMQGGELHDHAPYSVVGILKPTGTVLDRLVLTTVSSVWRVHETDPDEVHATAIDAPQRELTALLVEYASPLAAVTLPRWINSQSRLQAAQPAFEAARLFRMLGVGADVLRAIAIGVLLVAGLSMFVALYNALEERKTDMAIMRALGTSPARLLVLLLTQGLLLALGGAVLGWLLGHAGVAILGRMLGGSEQNLTLSGWLVLPQEAWLMLAALLVGLAAALLPAIRAYRTDIAATLAR